MPSVADSVPTCEEPEGPEAGQEEVGPGPHIDEARQGRCSPADRMAWDRHRACGCARAAVVADQRVPAVGEPAEARVVGPGLLNELELAPEARAQGEEVEAPGLAV